MNYEALLAIGIVILVLGVLLLIPGLWLARRIHNKLPEYAEGRRKLTKFGYLYFSLNTIILMVALSLEKLAPWITTKQHFFIVLSVIILGVVVEKIANKMGYKCKQ